MAHAHIASGDRLIDHLRATLNQQRRFRLQQLLELDAELDATVAPANTAATARREVTVKLADAARQALADIDETLTLITTGRYGRCRRCHAEIPIHLLQTIPTSQWCLDCQQHRPPDRPRPMRRTVFRTPRPDVSAEREILACR
ncbi:TraR/DksA family transcriptional regulator [Nocardia anaemiae]|uniref:TraR/DksA family transcriptional regulator n=1 Tax=Nocardia anaemiae TaxID=263910 RepID=UPI0007A48A35|nr:TraR/DksA family transcriptional regulator [Nocardia anaemiae]